MNVLLINDSSSNPNWGDRGAAIALKQMIKAGGNTLSSIITEDELRYGSFLTPPDENEEIYPNRRSLKDWGNLLLPPAFIKISKNISNRFQNKEKEQSPIPLTVDDLAYCADVIMKNVADYRVLHDSIGKADIAVIHGNGCIFGNGIMPRTNLFLGYLIKTRWHKPVILVNHTADLGHPDLDRMAAEVYPLFDDVTYREMTSAKLCRDRWPGRYAADSCFFFKPAKRDSWALLAGRPSYFDAWPDEADFDPTRPYICIGGSSIYSFNLRTIPKDIVDSFITLISHLQELYDGQIVLTASDYKDQLIFRPVAKALNLPILGLTLSVQQAVDILGNAQAYIGGRWHPSIFALSGGTPVVPLASKTFKMSALIRMTALTSPAFDAYHLVDEKTNIGQVLNDLISQGEDLRRQLIQWARQQHVNCWDNLSYLKSL